MVRIPLTGERGAGLFALISPEDEHLTLNRRWYLAGDYVASRKWEEKRGILLHRLIMGFPEGLVVDHINDDPLDNRRENLRIVTRGQNSGRGHRRNKTGYRGVTFHADRSNTRGGKRYSAAIRVDGRSTFLGLFHTAEEAAAAYDARAIVVYGELARLNFPND